VPTDDLSEKAAASFGEKLRAARLAAELTQERLAQLSALDRSQIGKLEAGHRVPKLDTIIRLAGALNMEPCGLIADVRWLPPSETPGSAQAI
jgi:transcriptional regulator with XRE-family HTH domain